MRSFYRTFINWVLNQYYWFLDYLYVMKWQTTSLVKRLDPVDYKQEDPLAPIVILLPGIYETWRFMKPIADMLYRHGYTIYVIESLGMNTGTIEEMADLVSAYAAQQKIKKYSIVAHSKGGLIAKYLLGKDSKTIDKVVTISAPYAGSVYAYLFPFQTLRTFLPNSKILTLLATDVISNKKITSVYGIFDPHIPRGSYLTGAHNVQLPVRGHFRILNDSKVHEKILVAL